MVIDYYYFNTGIRRLGERYMKLQIFFYLLQRNDALKVLFKDVPDELKKLKV